MAQVIAEITMSLDGYVTGPGADPQHGLGIGGEPLYMSLEVREITFLNS